MTAPARIAVGYDGSPDAEAAVRWAASLAATLGATVRVVHAVGLLEHAGLAPVAAYEARARDLALGEGIAADKIEWSVLDGDPDSVLCRTAQGPAAADLLVVGTRGAGAHTGEVLGSTSLGLAERATVPVVVVPSAPDRLSARLGPAGSPPA